IESIVKEYIALVNDAKNIMEAVAITAVPLNNEMLIKLQEILSKYSGKSVQLKNKIDTGVIGGVIVKAGDKVIDGTIKKRLEQMQMQMSQVKY
ncbi:MAG TPA: ATP synthase F1 subunit delta, partial [Clostridia bacterium]|nr:ATP synthase F1 subunit delta [Clostridia bacterium]